MVDKEKRPPHIRLALRLLHVYFSFARGMTVGVRAACFDADGRIFLVRHSYIGGWHMPGGGLERNETAEEALVKELREEGNLRIIGKPELVQVYFNTTTTKRDHVVFYRATVEQTAPRPPDWEISDSGFFSSTACPRARPMPPIAVLPSFGASRSRTIAGKFRPRQVRCIIYS